MPLIKYVAFKCLNAIDSLPPVSCEIRMIFLKNFFTWTQVCSQGSCSRKTLVSLSGHQQKALDCWRGGLTVQRRACTGRSEEWLELWWAKKMQFGEISEKVGGNERQGEGRSGGGGQCLEGTQRKSNSQSEWFKSKWVLIGEKKSCLLKQKPPLNLWLCGGAVRLIHFNQSYLWAHSACRIITTLSVLDWLWIQPIWRQGQSHRDAGAPICCHLILYLSLKVESHYLSSTIQNWGLLCPFRVRHSDRHWDKDRQPWLWPTSTTLPAWAVASRCTS